MSDFADKLAVQRPSAGGRAQATRKQLLVRHGAKEAGTKVITIDTMGGREVWRCVSGDIFEQEVRT